MITVSSNKAYYGLCIILFFGIAIVLLVLLRPSPLGAETRKPNRLERAYTALVTHGYSASLCEKISPKALNRFSFNSPGSQISYKRSECFFYAAATELNNSYCNEVVEATAWFLDGSGFSPESCRDFVTAGKPLRATIGIADHEELLRAAGFDDEDLEEELPDADPEMAWMDFYYHLKRNSGGRLQQSFERLPDFSIE